MQCRARDRNHCAAVIIALFIVCWCAYVCAAAIPPVSWERLTDTDISPLGKAALSYQPALWKHAETDHFVYHFTDEKQAETVYVHAEVYYRWIKDIFGITKDAWKKKNHIFVFSDEGEWKDFQARARVEWGSAFTNGWELYLYREPHYLLPIESLAHELTHVIVFRFLDGPIPAFLNEGFAEFIGMKAVSIKVDQMEQEIRPLELISSDEFMPLAELSQGGYPDKEKAGLFYRESGLLARFLIFQYKSDQFYRVMKECSRGKAFPAVIKEVYGTDLPALEERFKVFALKK